MDKRVMFAVAGAGKTTYVVNSLSACKRSLIVTYTNNNYNNLYRKIVKKFDGVWPANIALMTYERFLLNFCYKPFLADVYNARRLCFKKPNGIRAKKTDAKFYMTSYHSLYYNRLATLVQDKALDNVKERMLSYFDEFIIDEIQDFAGRDFNLLEAIMETPIAMLFVGDFYQHTYDTSRDGTVNKNLHDDYEKYINRFRKHDMYVDTDTLVNSWRCSKKICDFVNSNLGIKMESNKAGDGQICFVNDFAKIDEIMRDEDIVKLCYAKATAKGRGYRNWGDTKGEDCYGDVCVLLNNTTYKKYKAGCLNELKHTSRNRLYVAITRAHGNVYFIKEER